MVLNYDQHFFVPILNKNNFDSERMLKNNELNNIYFCIFLCVYKLFLFGVVKECYLPMYIKFSF